MDLAKLSYKNLEVFARPYAADTLPIPSDSEVTNLEDPLPSMGAELPAVPALEFLADVYEKEEDKKQEAIDVRLERRPLLIPLADVSLFQIFRALGGKHDTIRRK